MNGELDFHWLTADHINSGEYDGWLRVEVFQLGLQEGRNGDFVKVVYHSLGDSTNNNRRFRFSQNYFDLEHGDNRQIKSLGRVTGLSQLCVHNLHELVGKQLEVRVAIKHRQDNDFVEVISHRELTTKCRLR